MPESHFTQQSSKSIEDDGLLDYQTLVMNTPIGIFTSTPEGRFLSANPALARMLGYETPQELMDSITDIAEQIYAVPEDREEFKRLLELHGEVVEYECQMLRRDSSRFWCSFNALAVKNHVREITCYQGFVMDITRRRQIEKELRESEERFSKVFRSSPAPQAVSDVDTREIIDLNDRCLELSGYARDELIGRDADKLEAWADPGERDRLGKKLRTQGFLKNEPIELKSRTGQAIMALWSAEIILMHGRKLVLSMFYDETERRHAEQALRESRETLSRERNRLQVITETMGEGLYVFDTKGRITFSNSAAASILGYSQDELLGQVAHDLFHHLYKHDGRKVAVEDCPYFKSVISGRYYCSEESFKRKDGSIFPAEVTSRPMIGEEGVTGAVTVFSDISERKVAEIKLKNSEEKYRSLMEQSLDMIFLHDLKGNFLEVNHKASSRTGYSREKLLQMNVFDLHPDQTGKSEILDMWDRWSPGESIILEMIHVDKFGRKYPVEINTGKVRFGDKDYILATIRDITERKRAEEDLKESRQRYEYLLQSSVRMQSFQNIIGRSKKMQRIYVLLQQVAAVDTTVLITGETGTGKELIVEALHSISPRGNGPLIKVNCLTLADELLDSELFGHVRGAFTGAYANKIGRVEAAEGGTLFLDEIGDLSARIQLKLLRFLQEREYERVGESRTRRADVRIVAATNADLSRKVEEGSFRKDLYFRLKVMCIHVPRLKERSEDIPLLIQHFCRHFAEKFGKHIRGVSTKAMRVLLQYPWPGNVRELEHALEHGVLLCPGDMIEPEHLPEELQFHSITGNGKNSGKVDREELVQALEAAHGKKTDAARILGISRRTLYRQLHKHGLF